MRTHANNLTSLTANGLSPNRAVWFLRGRLDESAPSQTVYVNTSPFVVGRRSDVQLCLGSKVVSSRHAELVLEGDHLWVADTGSTNGTFVNGQPITNRHRLSDQDLVQFANLAFRVGLEQSESGKIQTMAGMSEAGNQAFSLVQFDKLMSEAAVVPFFQPIIHLPSDQLVGYEILGRSRFFGLQTPAEMFGAAMQLNMEAELSALMRTAGLSSVRNLPSAAVKLFLNTHPIEVVSFPLIESLGSLRESHPHEQLVLEIHEAAVTQRSDMLRLRKTLDELNIELAYDDFGSGQSRLGDLFEVPPDYLKFDMSLIRNIQSTSEQQRNFLGGMVKMVRDLGIRSLAEGVEVEEEHRICVDLGFDYGQGFFYGRPVEARQLHQPAS